MSLYLRSSGYSIALPFLILLTVGCNAPQPIPTQPEVDRLAAIPSRAPKLSPETDPHPPRSVSPEFEQPVPVPGSLNTAGGEDSPFITPDGKILYFFFTPDVSLPAERQVGDGVTGIYAASLEDGAWIGVERVWLQDPGKLSLDGCATVLGEQLWFCTARQGLDGVHWFRASLRDGAWQDWTQADFDPAYQVGELHISSDGQELYFHSARSGGQGGLDLWLSLKQPDGAWGSPENLAVLNSDHDEGWPALSPDGGELWFARDFGVWRARRGAAGWDAPELVIADLAGEPSIDSAGNVYFVHHFFVDDQMVEADLYVAYRK